MGLLELLIVVILLLWITGFTLSVAGNLVHLLLVIVIVLVIVRLVQGRAV